MATPTFKWIFNRKKTATQTKEAPVELRVTWQRKTCHLTTGVRLYLREWKDGFVIRRNDAEEIQETLNLFMKNARKAVNDMLAEGMLDISDIKRRMELQQKQGRSFIEFAKERAEVRKYGKREDTCQRFDRFIRFLLSYGKILHYSDITDINIMALDRYLIDKGMKPYSRWQNYHRFLNAFILDAISEGLLRRNPYKWVHIDKDKNSGLHKYLTPQELTRIETARMGTKTLERVRDLFIFQTYTCLSFSDLAAFDMRNAEQVDGFTVYTSNRTKTGKEFSFVLLRKAQAIYDKYDGHLPVISNQKYNDFLKTVAQTASVDKPITCHWARHTGATLLLNNGKLSMEVIAKILGDTVTQVRRTYAALLKNTIVSDMKELDNIL